MIAVPQNQNSKIMINDVIAINGKQVLREDKKINEPCHFCG